MASRAATKTRRIEIRITEEERELEQAAATATGESLSEFVRRAARREAERTLAERSRYVVDDEVAQRFLDALESPQLTPHKACVGWLRSRASYLTRDTTAGRRRAAGL